MSAGGFMTEVMMAAYPDVFAGGAVNSGGRSAFTARTGIDLSAFAGKTVTRKLVVTARDTSSTVTSASATIDQIQIH
jgi:poly(3-hydroxybutyrate) depolymerase